MAAAAGHDAIVNTIMAPNPSYGDGGGGFTINVTGVYNLLEAARAHGIKRFVHTSSGAVHAGYPQPPATFLTHDLYPLKASGPYALSKLLQEELTRNFHERHGMSIACIRPWGIIDAERMVTTDGHRVATFNWGHIDRRDVAGAHGVHQRGGSFLRLSIHVTTRSQQEAQALECVCNVAFPLGVVANEFRATQQMSRGCIFVHVAAPAPTRSTIHICI